MLFQEALPPRGSDSVLSTLSLVQVRLVGRGGLGSQGQGHAAESLRPVGSQKSLGLAPLCFSLVWAGLSGVFFFLPEMAEFWCLAWPTGLQWKDHVSQRLGKGFVCNRCCACVIPAQPQREDSGPALSRGREPVGARCSSSGLVSVRGPTAGEGPRILVLRQADVPKPGTATSGEESPELRVTLTGLPLTLFPSSHVPIPVPPLIHPLIPLQLRHYHPG